MPGRYVVELALADVIQGRQSHRQFRGSTQPQHSQELEPERMEHQRRSIARPLTPGSENDMTGSSSSDSDRQRARNKGLAAISAITLGAGAAGLVGAVGMALTLPSSTSATNAGAAGVASNTFTFTTNDDSGDDSGSQLQTGTAPTTTTVPPVATSAAS